VYRSGKSGANSKWRAEFRHPVTGEKVRARHLFATKAAGQDWEREERAKIHASGGEYRGPTATTIGEFIDAVWQPQRNVERSTADRDRALLPRLQPLRHHKLAELKRSTVNAWIKRMEDDGESPHVVRESLWLLSGMMKLAIEDGYRVSNPAKGARFTPPTPHDDRVLTDDEVDLISRQMPRLNDELFVLVLAFTGLRFGEAAALGVEHMDLRDKIIHVRWTLDKRTGKLKRLKGGDDAYRDVPIPTWLATRLADWLPKRPFPDDRLVFQGRLPMRTKAQDKVRRASHLRYDNWRKRAWEPAVVAARIAEPLPTVHDLRHYYGTKLGAAGVGESNIAALMGHSATSRVTRRYVQATESRLEQARQVMGG